MATSFKKVFETVQQVQWLWPGWLPRGQVSALIAEPGTGKSALALWLGGCAAQALPPGEALVWPDGQPIASSDQKAVIWCEAESRWAGHKTRADELKLPIDSFYSAVPYDRPFRLDSQSDLNDLEHAIQELNPALVVVDSLAAAHSHTRSENDAAMHRMIVPLQVLAAKYNVCVIIIHHLRKDDAKAPRTEVSLDDMRGSTAIGAVTVSVLALDRPDKGDKDNRRISHVKSNFSLQQAPVGFRWQQDKADAKFVFGEAPEVASALRNKDSGKQKLAESLLLAVLTQTWMPAGDAIDLIQRSQKTLSEETIRKAFTQMRNQGRGDMCRSKDQPPKIMWRLL